MEVNLKESCSRCAGRARAGRWSCRIQRPNFWTRYERSCGCGRNSDGAVVLRLDSEVRSVSQNALAGGAVSGNGEGGAVFKRFGRQWPGGGFDAEPGVQCFAF